MDAIPHLPRPPLRNRIPPRVRTPLAWAGAVAFPAILFVTVLNGAGRGTADLGLLGGISWRYLLPALAMILPAGLLRRRPLTALALMLVGAAVIITTMVEPWDQTYLMAVRYLLVVALDLAVCVIAAIRPRRVSIVVAVVVLVFQVASGFAYPIHNYPAPRPEIAVLAMLTAWMVGNSVRARRRYGEALRTQASAQAITAERLRIARELHDVVAHSIGIIAIQAGMGSRVMDTQPDETRNALRAIEATSRETLAGLRRMLGGLRHAQPDGGSEAAPTDPAPGLADLERLAATTMGAGVQVRMCWQGNRRPLPADIELSAYRIVQEAITNVVRHAGTPQCQVSVDYRDEELRVEITDNGRGCSVPGSGYGITGMRERVGLLHGEFSAGSRPEGGYRVAASLPLPAPVAASA